MLFVFKLVFRVFGIIVNMTKFILHGGNVGDDNLDNQDFFKEVTRGLEGQINCLINGFACDPARVEDKYKRHSQKFLEYSANKNISFQLANEKSLIEQIAWANVIFFEGGGSTESLMHKLKPFKLTGKSFENKVVSGSSAGANIFSKYFFGNESQKIGDGLGILDIKIVCHGNEFLDNKAIDELNTHKEHLPLIVVPDYKWVVLYN